MKKIISLILSWIIIFSALPILTIGVNAAYENTHVNTGNQAYDIVAIAQTQIGYQEGENNDNKYGAAFSKNNVAWCAYFISWCAKEAKISDSIIHRQGIASPFSGYFNVPNTHYNNDYFPKPGDLVFFGPNSDGDHYHVGLVETVNSSTGYITTIEGNTNSGGSSEGYTVYRHTRHYKSSKICCYGMPDYSSAHNGVHTCTKGTYRYYEAIHPHYKCYECSICGDVWRNAAEPTYVTSCDSCLNHACDKGEYVFYQAVHPHYNCYKCSLCGETWVDTASFNKLDSCLSCQCPEKPMFLSLKDSYTDTEKVIFKWDETENTTHYNIWTEYKNDKGEWKKLEHLTYVSSGVEKQFTEGEYRCILQAYNSNHWREDGSDWLYTEGDYHYFIIICSHADLTETPYRPADCDNEGNNTYYTCNSCGQILKEDCVTGTTIETETLVPLGHTPERKNAKSATCTADGYTGDEVCKTCGKTIKNGDVIKATGHKWDDGKVIKEATETTEGTKRFTCSVCGDTKDEAIPVTTHKHSFTDTVVAPTCTESGYTEHKCSCGESYKDTYTDALGHTPELKNAKSATCETDGYTGDEICKTCGMTVKSGEVIKATGHKWDNGKVIKEATETAEGIKQFTCTVCKQTRNESIPVIDHKHSFKDIIVKPTCTESGYTLHECACGESFKDKYTDALGHNAELKNAKSATCTTDGYTGDEVCKTCGKTIKQGQAIKSTGHNWDDGKIIKEPTETTEGTLRKTCTVCKETKDESIPVTVHKHSFEDTVVKPSCTENGYTLHKCSCGESYKDTYTDATGHSPELKNVKPAGCTTDGYTGDEICKTCGKIIKSGEVIKAVGHKWDEGKVTKEPTETTEGIKQFTCTVCEGTKEESIPVTIHKHNFKDTVVAPSCTESGYTEHKCSCGESYKDNYTNALGHTPELKNEKTATCTNDGYTGDEICKTCGKTIKSGEVIKVKGHSYANGKCSVCGAADPNYEEPKPEDPPIANPFNDVKESDWFYAPVLWAVQNNVTGGTSPTTFSPDAFCTRAQVVTFLWAANGKPEPTSMNNPFTDVSDSAWYCKAVMWAVEKGITGGTSPTTFSPDAFCTRAQVATFLYAAEGKPAVKNPNNEFIDVPDGAWYLNPVLWAKENDITGGIGGGKFGPDQTCTRAQIATFLYKAMG